MNWSNIRTRLLFYCSLSIALVVGVALVALVAIISLDRITEEFNQRWLPGPIALGEMADLISEVRLHELKLAGAHTPNAVVAERDILVGYAKTVEEQRKAYGALDNSYEEQSLLLVFDDNWRAWQSAQKEWLSSRGDANSTWARIYEGRVDALYKRADNSLDALLAANERGAVSAGARAGRLVDVAIIILWGTCGAALLLTVWLVYIVRNQISKPLASITSALRELASGNRNVVVPEGARRDEIGDLAKAFDVFRKNTFALEEAHRAAEAAQLRAQSLARHDVLTGLANRRVLSEELTKAVARATRGGPGFAVLLMDLDRFKPVNDIYGHAAGDQVLTELTGRLKGIVRKNDTLARIGGDEFAIILDLDPQVSEQIGPIQLAERVLESVGTAILVDGSSVEVGASIGIALFPGDGADPEAMIRAADIAMYGAKGTARRIRFFESSMDADLRARAALESAVRRAVLVREIKSYYQPLIDLSDGEVMGFEILARWHRPERGAVPPEEFIPIIEHLGLMPVFTMDILRRACIDSKQWPDDLMLSLNISPSELRDPLFCARLMSILTTCDFAPERLEIEITESALITDLETARTIIQSLQRLGVRVALDDFGTGYSSLSHLRELHLDKIKIDRSFIQSMNVDTESAKIVHAILGLARSLELPTTAEGIEDAEVLEQLSDAGCQIGQGYLFGRAMAADKVSAWITAQSRPGFEWKAA